MIPEFIENIAVAYPSGNVTAIVFDELSGVDLVKLNAAILASWAKCNPDKPPIEQCCFISSTDGNQAITKVNMFGNEFCANATRSVVWLLTSGLETVGLIEVSGSPELLKFEVSEDIVSLEIPRPQDIEIKPEGTLVRLPGIAQLVAIDKAPVNPRQLLQLLLAANTYDLATEPCVGVSLFDTQTNQARFSVWIKDVNTIFDETACGSGTAAIGMAMASATKENLRQKVLQPSGETISVTVTCLKNNIDSCQIAGTVDVLYQGRLDLL